MKRILVASDLSKRSHHALRRALSLARQFGAELTILHVTDDDRPTRFVEEERRCAEKALCQQVERMGGQNLASVPAVIARVGHPFSEIVTEANTLAVEVIVMGSHRKRFLGEVFTGTTVERVMRIGGRPVLMVNADAETPYRNVLAAVDLSDASANAMRTASALGLLDPASAAVVHGFMPLAEGTMAYAGIERERIAEHVAASAAEARSLLTTFLRDLGFGGMANLILIEKGTPFEAIDAAVKKMQADLLIIGTRGRGDITRALLGSVADQVLRGIRCDILAVPPEASPAES
jgi:universal stress protein E